MADKQHNILTGSSLHEPKGVASATDGEVAVASSSAVVWEKVKETSIDGTTGASANQVLMSDGTDAAWEDENSVVHGEIEVIGNSTATAIAVQGTYVEVTEGTPAGEHLSGITNATAYRLKVPSDGTYHVTATISFKSTTASADDYSFDIGKNGTVISHKATRSTSSASDIGNIALLALQDLATDDEISIMVTNDGSTDNVVIIDYTLCVFRINRVAVA